MKNVYLFITAVLLSFTSFAATTITGTTNICAGTTSSLSTITPGGTWSSSNTAVAAIGSASGILTGIAAGTATISYDDGTAIATVTATVNPTVYPSDSVIVSPGDTICLGGVATFTVLPTMGGSLPGYKWIVNGIPHGTGTAFSYIPADGDIVFCVMTTSEQCPYSAAVYSHPVIMTTVTSIEPSFTISASRPGVLERQYDTLTANVAYDGSVPSYQWVVEGVPVAGATSASYLFICSGCFPKQEVSCIVTGCGGVTKENKITVLIGEGVELLQKADNGISILPNPSSGEFYINTQTPLKTNEEVTISVINLYGAEIYRKKITPNNRMLNELIAPEREMVKGMYILKLSTSSGSVMQRVIIE